MIEKGGRIGDKYVVKEVLGKGVSGRVYLAENAAGIGKYTIKVSGEKELLKREARMAGEMNSEYFPRFIDYMEDSGQGYLVLEYVEGWSLQRLLDNGRRFTEKEILIIMEQVTAALSAMHYHKKQMVHLDIKPANIIITPKGQIRIIDMGAGSLVGERMPLKGGTYGYGAPEQFWQGILPGPEADVYACGKLMTYLFTGKNPCKPPYDKELRILKSAGVKKEWLKIICKCLKMEPGKRYPDANILHRELEQQREESEGSRKIGRKRYGGVTYVKSFWKSDYERV